jgi:hypothetical protein
MLLLRGWGLVLRKCDNFLQDGIGFLKAGFLRQAGLVSMLSQIGMVGNLVVSDRKSW